MPYMLSFMATHDFHGFVPGVNDIIKGGYTQPDGQVALPLSEKIQRGQKAITALGEYRKLKQAKADAGQLEQKKAELMENMPYFGYGYVKDKADVVPPVWINFWAFRAMVGLGCLFIAFFGLVLILIFDIPMVSLLVRRLLSAVGLLDERAADRTAPADAMPAWLCWAAVLMVPLAYIASESGWLVAEFGRQPWTIQDMLPTWAAVSDLSAGSVALTADVMAIDAAGLASLYPVADGALHLHILQQVFQRRFADQTFFLHRTVLLHSMLLFDRIIDFLSLKGKRR
jgi:cytochrome d ubiquinol oxidase subunit I